jgi:hypothetical protein
MSAEFMGAAYRVGHDLIPDNIGSYTISDIFSGEKFFLTSLWRPQATR